MHCCDRDIQDELPNEAEAVEKVQIALQVLKSRDILPSYQEVSKITGISKKALESSPGVRVLLKPLKNGKQQLRQREDTLFEQVRIAVEILDTQGELVTYQTVSKVLGIPWQNWMRLSKVRTFMEQIINDPSRTRQREEILVQRIQSTIQTLRSQGKSVTQQSICNLMGMGHAGLKEYPNVKEILSQCIKDYHDNQVQEFHQREAELVEQVQTIIYNLQCLGKLVTHQIVSEALGTPRQSLKVYPKVSDLLNRATEERLAAQKLKTQQHEEELVQQVKVVIQDLQYLGKPVTQQMVSEKVGITRGNLKVYPRVKLLMEEVTKERLDYQARQSQHREEVLVEQVLNVIQSSEASDKFITQIAISKAVNMSCSTLKRYPKVFQVLKDYHLIR